MHLLVTLLMNSSFGKQITKDIAESFACKSEAWMMSEYDEIVKDYWKISRENYIVKTIDDVGLEDDVKKLNTMPLHLGAFVLVIVKELWIILHTLLNDFLYKWCLLHRYWFTIHWKQTLGEIRQSWFSWWESLTRKKTIKKTGEYSMDCF